MLEQLVTLGGIDRRKALKPFKIHSRIFQQAISIITQQKDEIK